MKTIGLIALLILSSSFTKNNGCLKMDIILLGDTSSSVGSSVLFIADAFDSFVDRFDLADDGIRIGIITFESVVRVHTKLSSNKRELKTSIYNLRNERGNLTDMANGLTIAGNELMESGRPDAIKIIVLVTDGDPTDETGTEKISNELKELIGVGICGVLIVNIDSKPAFLKRISSDFCYVESSYENLINEFKKLDICL